MIFSTFFSYTGSPKTEQGGDNQARHVVSKPLKPNKPTRSLEVRHDLIGDVAESRSHTTMAISFDMLKTGRFSTASKLLVRAFLFSSLALQCNATPLQTVASNVLSFAYEHTNQAIWGEMPSIGDIIGNFFFVQHRKSRTDIRKF